ncbi:MAG: ATP phosphoribosyltransferase regulatory subunit [Spirochaetales bacterium]|nr:ATP phosphoribosyltransferase regulatory subunit [Spirochaetales bacterium]
MDNKHLFLHTPPGSKPFFKEEALVRNAITKRLNGFFENNDFFPIETPMIDYFDSYRDFFTNDKTKNCIRFIDQSGEVILLRNDVTLFAAKMVASRTFDKDNVLKYYYADSIIRNAKSGNLHEHYQIGCEMVGALSETADSDILRILQESLQAVGVSKFSLHIGDISVYKSVFSQWLKNGNTDELLALIKDRDIDTLRMKLSAQQVDADVIEDILTIASFIGSRSELEKITLRKIPYSVFDNLKAITAKTDVPNMVIDMSELSDMDYYNGMIYHVYVPALEIPIVSGGRYDLLFDKIGVSKQAVGFSYWLSPLQKAVSKE